MVRLQKLVLRNFKSFKKADIPISNGFTAIVGSNGSGKTNILDALLFVLGISSLKMLRASRLDELINNGVLENYAKVELSLKHDGNAYLIQRMIDKQGKSVYRLDGKRKTKNEITSLLFELGVKPEGHNIVVQGDTTRIIEMNPSERRQIIDELAGLQEFDAKKEEALKELEKVDNKLRDAGIVLQERESYLEQLSKDKDAAAEFESLELERKQIKATLLFSEVEKIENALKDGSAKIEKIGLGRKQLEEEAEQHLEKRTQLRAKSEALNQQILSQKDKIYAVVATQLEAAKTDKALLGQRIENKSSLVERNNARIAELEEKVESLDSEIAEKKQRVAKIGAELPGLREQVRVASEKKAGLEESASGKEKNIMEMQQLKDELGKQLFGLNETLFEKAGLVNSLKKEAELKKQAMRETMQFIEPASAKLGKKEEKKKLLEQLKSKYGSIAEQLSLTEKEAAQALDSLKEAEAEKRNVSESLAALQKSLATCPVCESELDNEKKKSLAAKKEESAKQLMRKSGMLSQRTKDLEARLANLREALDRERVLLAETADFDELKAELEKNRERLAKIKDWLQQNNSETLEAELEKIRNQIREKKAALSNQTAKVDQFQQSTAFSLLQEASNRVVQLQRQQEQLGHEKKSLLSDLETHLAGQKRNAGNEIESLAAENDEIGQEIESIERSMKECSSKIESLGGKLQIAEQESGKMAADKESFDREAAQLEESAREKQSKLKGLTQEENSLMIEKSKLEVRIADLQEEREQFKGIETIRQFDGKPLQERARDIDKRIEELGAINMKAIESFNQLETEVHDVREKVEKLDMERLAVVEMIEKIDVKRTNVFMECFEHLNTNFSRMFNSLFNGEGVLELSDMENPLEAGLLIQAKHKGENIRNIDSMSGGEKAMTALAFLFAIQLYEPAPFYVFDEADAALDKENSIKMAKIVKEISSKSQFIAITHNDPLVQEADQVIGVALNKQKSSVIGLKLRGEILSQQAS